MFAARPPTATLRQPRRPVVIFSTTTFISAFLLFWIQPMIAKMVLPMLGGSPSVWNTCMVFFQAMLLAGYSYAHVVTTRLSLRLHTMLHIALLALPLVVLPIALPHGWMPPADTTPIPWLLGLLTVSIGLPLFVVATSAPLLQRWFAMAEADGGDPYFLYAASNLGSLFALVSYPTLMEPHVRLTDQRVAWTLGYGALVALTVGCLGIVWRTHASFASASDASATSPDDAEACSLPFSRQMRWILLAFAPSSLMLGVTTYVSTDIAAVPLLWVIPLALYLLTFVLVFARRPLLPHTWMVRVTHRGAAAGDPHHCEADEFHLVLPPAPPPPLVHRGNGLSWRAGA